MKFIRKNIKIISIIIVVIITISLIVLKVYLNKNVSKKEKTESVVQEEILIKENIEETPVIEFVNVDIKGAVKSPGVYEIENDKKVIDVVNKAGGLTENSDTSMINLAKQVTNEMVIIIYTKKEVEKYTKKEEIVKIIDKECVCPEITNDACINNNSNNNNKTSTNSNNTNKESNNIKIEATENEKINLNKADIKELQTLSGIGESKAQAIIDYRQEHGKFSSIEELKEVSGIGDALYEKIKDNITV